MKYPKKLEMELFLLFAATTSALSAQSRPTLQQLLNARNSLEITFIFDKQQYFPGEIFKGQIKVKNPTNSTLIVPKVFHPYGDAAHFLKFDTETGLPFLSRIGSSIETDEEPYAAPYPLQTLAPMEEVVYTNQPLAEWDRIAPQFLPRKPGTYILCFLGVFSQTIEVVDPTVEALSQSLWPELIGGDPQLGPVLDPAREGYRLIMSVRWQNKSFICLGGGLGSSIAGTESQYIGKNALQDLPIVACFAESTLPITSVSGTHDGAKNLTVSYTDSQAITRTFRVDENLNLLP